MSGAWAGDYDVLILGGGIAAAGLACNLRRARYSGSIAVLDRNGPGSAGAYGFRNTFRAVIDEYGIPYRKEFRGLRDAVTTGRGGTRWMDIDVPCYFYHYEEACKAMLAGAGVVHLTGEAVALDPGGRRLSTHGEVLGYGVLVDCSGPRAWTRGPLGLPKAGRYYVGSTYSIPLSAAGGLPDFFDPDRFIYYTEANGYMEDAYVLGENLLYGVWNYSASPDTRIGIREGGILSRFQCFAEMGKAEAFPAAIAAEPVYPIVHGQVAYLGDSGGQATPASSEGTRPILEASRLLARVIAEGADLDMYQEEWFNRTAREYTLHRALKEDMRSYNRFFSKLRKHPDVYRDLALNLNPSLPFGILLTSLPYLLRAYWTGRRDYSLMKQRIRSPNLFSG